MLRGQTVNIFLSTVPRYHSYLAFATVSRLLHTALCTSEMCPAVPLKALC